jgi:hypothetical protein
MCDHTAELVALGVTVNRPRLGCEMALCTVKGCWCSIRRDQPPWSAEVAS